MCRELELGGCGLWFAFAHEWRVLMGNLAAGLVHLHVTVAAVRPSAPALLGGFSLALNSLLAPECTWVCL